MTYDIHICAFRFRRQNIAKKLRNYIVKLSMYDEAESGEILLEACEYFFRYRVHLVLWPAFVSG